MRKIYKYTNYADMFAISLNEEQLDLLEWIVGNLDIFEEDPKEISEEELQELIEENGEDIFDDISSVKEYDTDNPQREYVISINCEDSGDIWYPEYVRITPSQVALFEALGVSNWYDWEIEDMERTKYSYDGSKFIQSDGEKSREFNEIDEIDNLLSFDWGVSADAEEIRLESDCLRCIIEIPRKGGSTINISTYDIVDQSANIDVDDFLAIAKIVEKIYKGGE